MKVGDEEHFDGKIAQKVIVENDGRVLLVKDPRVTTNLWELPGGRMNIDEEPREAVVREFMEEMGREVSVHEVVYLQQFMQFSEGRRAFLIVYRATLADEKEFTLADDEVSEVGWFTKEEVKQMELYPEYVEALNIYFN